MTPASGTLELAVQGPFSLALSVEFARRFAPAQAWRDPRDERRDKRIEPVFRTTFVDDGGGAASIAVREAEDGALRVDYVADLEREQVAAHAARILSVDLDGTEFLRVGERDPVVAELQQRWPGLRPTCLGTPWEAAAWAVLNEGTSKRQAAKLKASLSRTLGTRLELDGSRSDAFPAPHRLLALSGFPGLSDDQSARLRQLAVAALDGKLTARRLRALEPETALAALDALPGVLPFSAPLILIRGAGHPDVLLEPTGRLRRSIAASYELDDQPGDDRLLTRVADPWRPYRSWVMFLHRQRLDEEPH